MRTQDHLINDDGGLEPAWGDTKSWPAAILLTVASISAFLSIRKIPPPNRLIALVVLLSYLKSVKLANRLAAVNATIMITASVVALGIWAISAGLFHKQETGFNVPNIWSWACNHKTSSDSSVNFNQICLTQVPPPSSPHYCLAETDGCRTGRLFVQLSRLCWRF